MPCSSWIEIPRLAADTTNAVLISAIVVVHVAIVAVEDPRVVAIVGVQRSGPF